MKPIEIAPKWYEIARSPEEMMSWIDGLQEKKSQAVFEMANNEYFHWEVFKHKFKDSIPSLEKIWAYVNFYRQNNLKKIPLIDTKSESFGYWLPDSFLKGLHYLDQNMSGTLLTDDPQLPKAEREVYIINSLMEEAIASSQLEGAAATRRVAKEMLRSGRAPHNHAEQMILNNYKTMLVLKELLKEKLNVEMIKQIHKAITLETLNHGEEAGRFRKSDEEVKVIWDDGQVLHIPPPAEELEERVGRMCDFANSEIEGRFIHPVIKAIILHFWLAYDHPFVDGNGRTARALFYWYMLKEGYWVTEFLSISRIIKKAPAQYVKAFLYTETDHCDLTYFIGYHLRVIELAVKELTHYLKKKKEDQHRALELVMDVPGISYRQSKFLHHVSSRPPQNYTIEYYKVMYSVTYETARKDLQRLVERKMLQMFKDGRTFYYRLSPKCKDHIRR